MDIADNHQYQDPFRDSNKRQSQSERIQFPPGIPQIDDITPRRNSYPNPQPPASGGASFSAGQNPAFSGGVSYEEPSYREHVSGVLAPHPPVNSPAQQAYSSSYQQPAWPTAFQQPQAPQRQSPAYPQQQQFPAYPQQQQPPVYPQQQQPAYPPNGAYYPSSHNPYYYAPAQPFANSAQGYYHPYAGYYGYSPYQYPSPYAYPYYYPQKPKRDGYLLGINIAALVCSSLVALGGLVCALLLLTAAVALHENTSPRSAGALFGGLVMFTALTIACFLGGGFGIYHGVRSLIRRQSVAFKLSWLGVLLFLASYIVIVIIGAILGAYHASVSNIPFTVLLITFAGLLPAATFLALGVRRVSTPLRNLWATTWRRFSLAVLSGTTSAIVLALVFEFILQIVLGISLGITSTSLDNPNQPMPNDPKIIVFMFLIYSVVAPLVEESVKPLAAILLIKRVSSAAEAFTLGLACGIGFDLIETSGYIGQGYQSWLTIALERSTAGLLHGFGAAMTTLGWYIITHPQEVREEIAKRRYLIGFGCMLYAVLQHAIWNGSALLLVLLPAPIGPFFDHGTIPLVFFNLDAGFLPYIVLSILMIVFFVFVTGKVRDLNNKNRAGDVPPMPQQQFPQAMSAPVYV